ncbi:MAG: DUF6379 domain-containing protein, partial [Steroidobacteraceae bacterium]|nr:DUF6379 domain-containing protein [Steroidobacteraceae bacterium]
SLQRVADIDGAPGFALLARLPYYRGLGLSMVEDIAIKIDGLTIPRDDIRFSVRGRTWTLQQMETEYGDRWNFGEKARILCRLPQGLAAGPHTVEASIRMRISYLPFTPTTTDRKVLSVAPA